jgi:membrane associated rhomboid family serine protease
MKSLLSIGPSVEKRWGASSFLKIAALTGIIKVAAQSELAPYSRSVGASALLYGMEGALHAAEIRDKGISKTLVKKIFSDLARQTAYALALETFTDAKIGHVGHLSGYIAGFAFGLFSSLNKT